MKEEKIASSPSTPDDAGISPGAGVAWSAWDTSDIRNRPRELTRNGFLLGIPATKLNPLKAMYGRIKP
jgi:hypothetical protein